MGKVVTFFSGTIFGLLLSGLVVTGIANTEIDKAYLIVSGKTISDEDLEAYSEKAGPVAQKAGINLIARNEQVTSDLLFEGSWENEGFVEIEEFSSVRDPRRKYDLPQPINFEDLSSDEKELFREIQSIGGSVSVGFPPMWLRGLARYPSTLPLAWAILTQIEANGQLAIMKKDTREASNRYSSILSGHITRIPIPNSAREAIERLGKLCDAIPRAMPVCLTFKKAFSGA